jgi:putative transposase
MLPALKDEHSWLGETNSQSLQQTLKLLEKAIEAKEKANAIRKARGEGTKNPYPRFRCKGRSESFIVPQHFSLTKTRAKIPKLPTTLRYVKHRFFVGRPKRLIITKDGDQYYLIVVCERRDVPAVPTEAETAVGIDMGVKLLYAASDGECEDPIDLGELERRKRILQKELERRTLRNADGTLAAVQSKGRGRTKKELSRVCRKIRNKRGDVHGRCVKRLADRHGCVFAEDLGIGNMTKRAHDRGGGRRRAA